jgi:hypothetical protein
LSSDVFKATGQLDPGVADHHVEPITSGRGEFAYPAGYFLGVGNVAR